MSTTSKPERAVAKDSPPGAHATIPVAAKRLPVAAEGRDPSVAASIVLSGAPEDGWDRQALAWLCIAGTAPAYPNPIVCRSPLWTIYYVHDVGGMGRVHQLCAH